MSSVIFFVLNMLICAKCYLKQSKLCVCVCVCVYVRVCVCVCACVCMCELYLGVKLDFELIVKAGPGPLSSSTRVLLPALRLLSSAHCNVLFHQAP